LRCNDGTYVNNSTHNFHLFGRDSIIGKIVTFLYELGTQPHEDPTYNQITRLINKICLFVILVITPHMLLTYHYGSMPGTLAQLGGILLLVLTLFLNARHYFNLARPLALLVGNLHIFNMALLLGPDSGVYFYFSAAVIAPMFFYTIKELRTIFFFAAITTLLASLIHIMGAELGPIIKTPQTMLTMFFYFSVFGSQATVFGFVYYFYLESNRLEKSLELTNQKLLKLSVTDPLTQLPNRRSFFKDFEREWGKGIRSKSPCAIIMMDMDLFKRFNDNYGHQEGDHCLVKVAKIIANTTREYLDFPARYGGEEFIIFLSDTTLPEASFIANRIHHKILKLAIPDKLNQEVGVVTCSLGVAGFIPNKHSFPDEQISRADKALYKAKENGRNRVEVAS
jgi:diguanylate cyclase (GGDEF)-like protein